MQTNNYLILDIETIIAPDAELFMPEFTPPMLNKDGSESKRGKSIEQQKAEWLDKCALKPFTGQVAVIGVNANGTITQYRLNQGGEVENEIILEVNTVLDHCLKSGYDIIGFNIKKFDLPFLTLRGLKYGIKPAWHYDDKFNKQIKDIAEYFTQGNYDWKFPKCNDVFKYFGLDEKLADGSEFGTLWETDKEKALEYNKQELIQLEKVAKIIYY